MMLKNETKGIKINGMSIYCIRFVDDIPIVAELDESMNKMLLSLTNVLYKLNPRMNSRY